MSFADQLRDERKRLGLTQAGADAVLDTCRGQVAAWESGRNTPHVLTQEGALARLRKRAGHFGGHFVRLTIKILPPAANDMSTKPEIETPLPVGSDDLVVPCECRGWARLFDGIHDKGTNHHPNCPRVDDSLIDVWRVSYDGVSYVTDTEPDDLPACEKVAKERMHRELYDALPEHVGF